jgi:AcrR family transcriptional regulator
MAMASETAGEGTTPRRGPYRNGAKTRAQIVEAASRVFAESGYAGGSLRQIAARVEVSPASMLQHFGSKEGLLTAVMEDWRASTRRLGVAGAVGIDHFTSLVRVMGYHIEHRGLIELFLMQAAESTSGSSPARAFVDSHYLETVAVWTGKLAEAEELGQISPMTPAQREVEVRTLIAVMDGLELQWLLDPRIDLLEMFSAHLKATIDRWR